MKNEEKTMKWQLPICSACCMKGLETKTWDSKTKMCSSENSIIWKWKSIEKKKDASKNELKHQNTKTYTASFDNGLTGETISNTIFGMLKLLEEHHWKIKWIYYYYSRIKPDDIPNGIMNGKRGTVQRFEIRNAMHTLYCILYTAYLQVVPVTIIPMLPNVVHILQTAKCILCT